MLKEFKAFILRGNVLDLAVAVIIGVAFGAIIASLVNDIIMPPIGMVLGKVDFKTLYWTLDGKTYETLDAARKASAPVIAYGAFLNTLVNFLIVAFVIFLIVKAANSRKTPVVAAAAPTKDCPYCAMAIPLAARKCPQCTSALS